MTATRALHIAVGFWIVLLGGCAAEYRLSDSDRSHLAQMDDERALRVIVDALTPSQTQGGLCASNSHQIYSRPRLAGSSGSSVQFLDYDQKDKEVEYSFDFRQVTALRLIEKGVLGPGPCSTSPENRQLGIFNASGVAINAEIENERFSEFVAAIVYFSPDAELKGGVGF